MLKGVGRGKKSEMKKRGDKCDRLASPELMLNWMQHHHCILHLDTGLLRWKGFRNHFYRYRYDAFIPFGVIYYDYINIYTYTSHTHTHVCIHTCMYDRMPRYTCVCVRVRMCETNIQTLLLPSTLQPSISRRLHELQKF